MNERYRTCFLKYLLCLSIYLSSGGVKCIAQLPKCAGTTDGIIYYAIQNKIYNYDPSQAISATNPVLNTIALPPTTSGTRSLAIGPNLNGSGPAITFYTIVGLYYYYYDGNTWVNTNHIAAVWPYVGGNIGAGGGLIYNMLNTIGMIKYNGKSDGVFHTFSPQTFSTAGDMTVDCSAHFYLLNFGASELREYDTAYTMVHKWAVTGLAMVSANTSAYAIVGNKVYLNINGQGMYIGLVTGDSVHFSQTSAVLPHLTEDMAACPIGGFAFKSGICSADTAYYCGKPVMLSATGKGPFTWGAYRGDAIISGSGSSVSAGITKPGSVIVTEASTDYCALCTWDTMIIDVAPQVIVKAGANDTFYNCGMPDTLQGSVNNTAGLKFNYQWSPATAIVSGGNTLTPAILPLTHTSYVLYVSLANNAGCSWADTVDIHFMQAKEGKTAFDQMIHFGCTEDTVLFTNKTTTVFGPLLYNWSFGDAGAGSTLASPKYIYKKQDKFDVTLIINNGHCQDTLTRNIDTRHPLKANISFSRDSFCKDQFLFLDGNSSVVNKQPAKYTWDLGDGTTGNEVSISHKYTELVPRNVRLTVTDALKCSDTAYREIYPDYTLPPYIQLGPADTVLCDNTLLQLPLQVGTASASFTWQDGSSRPEFVAKDEGIYFVQVVNQCGTAADTLHISYKDCSIWLPDAFTPNGNDLNDVLHLLGDLQGITSCKWSIYNRWGVRVFLTTDPHAGWDGRYKGVMQGTDTYFYLVEYQLGNKRGNIKGSILLLL